MMFVRALPRIEAIPDHALILLTTGLPRPQHRRKFKFELGWLLRDGFHDMVEEVLEKPVAGSTPSPQYTDGITKCVHYVNSLVVGLGIRWVSSKKRSFVFHLSLMN